MAAVTRVFVAGDGNWNTAASWNPAAVPLITDNVFFGPDSPALLTPPSAGANKDVKLGNFTTHPLYKYAVASSGSPVECSAAQILIQHPGDFFFKCYNDGTPNNKTDRVIVSCPSKNLGQKIELGSSGASLGEIDYIEILRGAVTLTDTQGINEVHVDYVENMSGDAELTINSGVATIPLIRAEAGRIHCSTTVTALHCDGAVFRQLLATITNLYGSAGLVEFNTPGTIALARLAGTLRLDLTQDVNVKTITELNLSARSIINKFDDAVMHVITRTNDNRKAA